MVNFNGFQICLKDYMADYPPKYAITEYPVTDYLVRYPKE